MWPTPVQMPGAAPGVPMFRPSYHMWGRFVKTFDGKPFETEDGLGDALHFFDAYYTRQLGSPDSVNVTNADMAEGWFEINIEGSLTSQFPSLMALSGG